MVFGSGVSSCSAGDCLQDTKVKSPNPIENASVPRLNRLILTMITECLYDGFAYHHFLSGTQTSSCESG